MVQGPGSQAVAAAAAGGWADAGAEAEGRLEDGVTPPRKQLGDSALRAYAALRVERELAPARKLQLLDEATALALGAMDPKATPLQGADDTSGRSNDDDDEEEDEDEEKAVEAGELAGFKDIATDLGHVAGAKNKKKGCAATAAPTADVVTQATLLASALDASNATRAAAAAAVFARARHFLLASAAQLTITDPKAWPRDKLKPRPTATAAAAAATTPLGGSPFWRYGDQEAARGVDGATRAASATATANAAMAAGAASHAARSEKPVLLNRLSALHALRAGELELQRARAFAASDALSASAALRAKLRAAKGHLRRALAAAAAGRAALRVPSAAAVAAAGKKNAKKKKKKTGKQQQQQQQQQQREVEEEERRAAALNVEVDGTVANMLRYYHRFATSVGAYQQPRSLSNNNNNKYINNGAASFHEARPLCVAHALRAETLLMEAAMVGKRGKKQQQQQPPPPRYQGPGSAAQQQQEAEEAGAEAQRLRSAAARSLRAAEGCPGAAAEVERLGSAFGVVVGASETTVTPPPKAHQGAGPGAGGPLEVGVGVAVAGSSADDLLEFV